MGCSPPGSSVHGISQARILEWAAISFSNIMHIWLQLKKTHKVSHVKTLPFVRILSTQHSDLYLSFSYEEGEERRVEHKQPEG